MDRVACAVCLIVRSTHAARGGSRVRLREAGITRSRDEKDKTKGRSKRTFAYYCLQRDRQVLYYDLLMIMEIMWRQCTVSIIIYV